MILSLGSIITFLAAIANLLLGLFTLHKNPRNATNRLFFLFAVSLSSYLIVNHFAISQTTSQATFFWVKTIMAEASVINWIFYILVTTYPRSSLQTKKITFLLTGLVSLLLVVLAYMNLIFSSVQLTDSGTNSVPGPAMPVFLLQTFTFLGGGFFNLIKKFRRSRGIEKIQQKLLLYATIAMFFAILLTNLIVVIIFNTSVFVGLLPIYITVFVATITYSIVKHRFLDIGVLVARTVSFTLLLAIISAIYAVGLLTFSYFVPQEVRAAVTVILALILAVTFNPLRRILERVTENIFHKRGYDSEELLEDLGNIMSSTLSLNSLTEKVINQLQKTIHITKSVFLLFSQEDDHIVVKSFGYKSTPDLSIEDIKMLAKRAKSTPLVFEELDEGNTKKFIRSHDISVVIPLQVSKKLHGIFVISEKSSGDIYTKQDIEVLEIFGPQISVAIQNSLAYDEIRRFNITLKKEIAAATKRLRKANRDLRHLDKLKDEFVFIATHELKNPVTAMRGYLYMLQKDMYGKIPEKMQEAVEQINTSNQQLVQLVNDLLQIARAEAKTITIKTEPIDLCEIVDEIVKSLKPLADQKKLSLAHDCKDGSMRIEADSNRLKEILNNLLSNSIKYSNKGTVTVTHAVDEKQKDMVITNVVDQGDGISEKDQEKIFTRFFRSEEELAKGVPGTGLGLFIVKQLVEKMGGKIWFESKLGEGSTFSFSLPKA
jgi:signal transduction histidine kinase